MLILFIYFTVLFQLIFIFIYMYSTIQLNFYLNRSYYYCVILYENWHLQKINKNKTKEWKWNDVSLKLVCAYVVLWLSLKLGEWRVETGHIYFLWNWLKRNSTHRDFGHFVMLRCRVFIYFMNQYRFVLKQQLIQRNTYNPTDITQP